MRGWKPDDMKHQWLHPTCLHEDPNTFAGALVKGLDPHLQCCHMQLPYHGGKQSTGRKPFDPNGSQ